MALTKLQGKNSIATGFLMLLNFAIPDLEYLSHLKNFIFIFPLIFGFFSVFLLGIIFNTAKNSEDHRIHRRKISLPFFKSGLILVLTALLSAALSVSTMVIMIFVYGSILSLIISSFHERQVPTIFKTEDIQRVKKVIRLGLFPLTLSSFVMFFLYEISDLYAFFVMVYVIAFFLAILWLCCIVMFLYRLLTMKFEE